MQEEAQEEEAWPEEAEEEGGENDGEAGEARPELRWSVAWQCWSSVEVLWESLTGTVQVSYMMSIGILQQSLRIPV